MTKQQGKGEITDLKGHLECDPLECDRLECDRDFVRVAVKSELEAARRMTRRAA